MPLIALQSPLINPLTRGKKEENQQNLHSFIKYKLSPQTKLDRGITTNYLGTKNNIT